jgi:hypothetical protein
VTLLKQVRWQLFLSLALAGGLAASPLLVLATQQLNGVSFSAMWMAGVSYADENAPAGMSSSAQGLFGSTIYGVGGAIGGLLGGHGLYLFFGVAVLAIVGLVAWSECFAPATNPV